MVNINASTAHTFFGTLGKNSSTVDVPISVSVFDNLKAEHVNLTQMSLRDIKGKIHTTKAINKANLPLLKLARFGTLVTYAGSIRHDANMESVSGIEGDYDNGQVSMDDAAQMLKDAGIAALLYTSTHHTPDKPRWRVLCPLAQEVSRIERNELCAKLNGALGGILGDESFAASQSFYFGWAENRDTKHGAGPACPVSTLLLEGKPLDKVDNVVLIYKTGGSKPPFRNTGMFDDILGPESLPNFNRIEVAVMLAVLNPDVSHSEWIEIGMAIHHESQGSDEGFDLWNDWSAKGKKYKKHAMKKPWYSFKHKDGGVTIGTLKYLAQNKGWEPKSAIIQFEDYGPEPKHSYAMALTGTGMLMKTGNGKLISNQSNAILLLGRYIDQMLPGLRRNLMTGSDEWDQGEVDDAAIVLVRVALERKGITTIGKEIVADAISTVAQAREVHPIRDWFMTLQHDGTPRLENFFPHYFKTESSEYTRAVGRAFLISMVSRVMQPGCKADYVVVLTGKQGMNKSSACRVLAGEDYFSESMPAIRGDAVESRRHLLGKWLIEMAELASARKSEIDDLKAFITGQVDKVRQPYARRDKSVPRQCVFIGTVNEEEFLADNTGGRRFWPVRVTQPVDLNALAADRSQLFAEAVAAYQAGERGYFDRDFEEKYVKPMQDAARVSDSWKAPIQKFLNSHTDESSSQLPPYKEVSIDEILWRALDIPRAQHAGASQRRVAAILKQMGWASHHLNSGNVWRK